VGEYTGRRRGRPAAEPPSEEPGYESGYQDEYYYEQPTEYSGEYYDTSAAQYPSFEQPSYQPEYPSYEPGYGEAQHPSYEPQYEAPGYGYEQQAPSYEAYGYEAAPDAEPEAPRGSRRGHPAPDEAYAYGEYTEDYGAEDYGDYPDTYAEPRFEPRRRTSGAPQPEAVAAAQPRAREPRLLETRPLTSHLPFIGAVTAALVVASFVSPKAIAGVVLPLQLVVAWAILDLAGFASRRTAVLVALPTLAGTVGTFTFQPDEAATAVAGGLGAGFFLLAADAVFRARRRGVEPGTVRAIAAAASALLFAGLTGMFVPAARLDTTSVAIGAAIGAALSLLAARSPELGSRRAVVVAVPATAAALASYAAAILVA